MPEEPSTVNDTSERNSETRTQTTRTVPSPPTHGSSKGVLTDKMTQHLPVPYLASLTAFIALLVGTFYSMIGLVGFALDKLIIVQDNTQRATGAAGFSVPDFSSYVVIAQVATLLVCLPATVAMAVVLRKYEAAQPWRLTQKMRRAIYITGAVLLIGALVSTVVTTAYGLFHTNLELKQLTSSVSTYGTDTTVTIDKGSENAKTILQGIFNVAILCAGLLVLTSNYAARSKRATWIVLGVLGVVALILIPYSTYQVHQNVTDHKQKVEKAKKEREERERQRNNSFDSLRNRYNSLENNNSSSNLF